MVTVPNRVRDVTDRLWGWIRDLACAKNTGSGNITDALESNCDLYISVYDYFDAIAALLEVGELVGNAAASGSGLILAYFVAPAHSMKFVQGYLFRVTGVTDEDDAVKRLKSWIEQWLERAESEQDEE